MKKNIIRILAFLIGLVIIVSGLLFLFSHRDRRCFQTWTGFYAEKSNSLDAVYIGASNVYAFWCPLIAWKNEGITVYPLALPNMPARSMKNMIIEARKTQPDALYILNINNFKNVEKYSVADMHNICDYMRLSKNKVDTISNLVKNSSDPDLDQLEFYLPFIRFHSRWSELVEQDYEYTYNGLKGSSYYTEYLKKIDKASEQFIYFDKKLPLTDSQKSVIDDILDYCDKENVKVLFLYVPQAIDDKSDLGYINTMMDYLSEKGHNVIDFREYTDEMGIDYSRDFYNSKHTNIHGSIKFTSCLSRLLKEEYGFTDKREDRFFESWNKAYDKYYGIIEPYVFDIELDGLTRDYSLPAPKIKTCSSKGQSVLLEWNKVGNAAYYYIYRRKKDPQTNALGSWEYIKKISADEMDSKKQSFSYWDNGLERNTIYDYSVVAASVDENNKKQYGFINYSGKRVKTMIPAPELTSLKKTENGITITWEKVEDVDGYAVYRKINGQKWIRIQDNISVKDCSFAFEDTTCVEGVPYLYTVIAYQYVDEEKQFGDCDHRGLLWLADLENPIVELSESEKYFSLKWGYVDGANYYNVYRMDNNSGEWTLVKGNLTQNTYNDPVASVEGNSNPVYKVSAVLKYRGDTYEYYSDIVDTITTGD